MFINSNNTETDTNIDSSFKNNNEDENKKTGLTKIIIIAVIAIVLIVGIVLIFTLSGNKSNTNLELLGGDINIYKNSEYIEIGYTAKNSKGEDLSRDVKVKNEVDTENVGEYTVTYTLNDKTLTRKVNVVEKTKKSTIIVPKGETQMTVLLNNKFDDPGSVVIDSDKPQEEDYEVIPYGTVNTSKVGEYRIVYTYVNEDGVTVMTERKVYVVENNVNN